MAPALENSPIDCQDVVKVIFGIVALAAPQDVMVGAGDDGNRVDLHIAKPLADGGGAVRAVGRAE